MLPSPTVRAVLLFSSALLCVLVGWAAQVALFVDVGGVLLLFVSACLALTVPAGRLLRHRHVAFAWWLDGPGHTLRAGQGASVRCRFRSPWHGRVIFADLCPVHDATVSCDVVHAVVVEPRARTDFELRFVCHQAGRTALHGMAGSVLGPLGLFRVAVYFPNWLELEVLPRATPDSARRLMGMGASGAPVGIPGAGVGDEGDWMELRDYFAGAPFRRMAWKASAKRGRLLMVEREETVRADRWILLDMSVTGRRGAPGERPLDKALELAFGRLQAGWATGERLGVGWFDGVQHQVGELAGPGEAQRVYTMILRGTECYDPGLTDALEDEVVAHVGRYLKYQEGLHFHSTEGWNRAALERFAASHQAAGHGERWAAAGPAPGSERSGEPLSALRAYCRARSLPFRARSSPVPGTKDDTLGMCLTAVLRRAAGGGASVEVITDGEGFAFPPHVRGALRALRAAGGQVTMSVVHGGHGGRGPGARGATGSPPDGSLAEGRARLVHTARQLATEGITVLPWPPLFAGDAQPGTDARPG